MITNYDTSTSSTLNTDGISKYLDRF